MVSEDNYYFTDSPVVINIAGYEFGTSAIRLVVLEVLYNDTVVGEFHQDVGDLPDIDIDISSALKTIWSEYDFSDELLAAKQAADNTRSTITALRPARQYKLRCHTEYIDSIDGTYTKSEYIECIGGYCALGGFTELERHLMDDGDWSIAALYATNPRNGDASTKPRSTPELVGSDSITSWVGSGADGNTVAAKCVFYGPDVQPAPDDNFNWNSHAPMVLRDTQPYIDFLFVNRRGALETCSARMLESMSIPVSTQRYNRTGAPSFRPDPSGFDIAEAGRRTWSMSSGYQTREWAEWWVQEFLPARMRWMRYNGVFLPVSVEPAKKQTVIYDSSKQQHPSVEFTVTLLLAG